MSIITISTVVKQVNLYDLRTETRDFEPDAFGPNLTHKWAEFNAELSLDPVKNNNNSSTIIKSYIKIDPFKYC
jgi:hypothetical protein